MKRTHKLNVEFVDRRALSIVRMLSEPYRISMADQRPATTPDKPPYSPFVEEIDYNEIEHIDVSEAIVPIPLVYINVLIQFFFIFAYEFRWSEREHSELFTRRNGEIITLPLNTLSRRKSATLLRLR